MAVMQEHQSVGYVVCWGSACEGNFQAPGWPPVKSMLVPVDECRCRYVEKLRSFFGHRAAAASNVAVSKQG